MLIMRGMNMVVVLVQSTGRNCSDGKISQVTEERLVRTPKVRTWPG